jgi:ribosomal protein S18 acetylase RimI-like enzyme
MMNIRVRKATENDIVFIQGFGNKLAQYEKQFDPTINVDYPFTKTAKERYLRAIDGGYVTIAYDEKKPVGFLIGTIAINGKDTARNITQATLHNIYVEREYRGKGIGEMLAEDFRKYCKENGVNRLYVGVNSENSLAIKFYEKVRFLPCTIYLSQDIE